MDAARGLCVHVHLGDRAGGATAIRLRQATEMRVQILDREPCLKLPLTAANAK
jgi:hypothetical protein